MGIDRDKITNTELLPLHYSIYSGCQGRSLLRGFLCTLITPLDQDYIPLQAGYK